MTLSFICKMCKGKEHCQDEGKCCWQVLAETRQFKRKVVSSYLLEAIFDAIISFSSVVLDIVSFILYTQKQKYYLAVLTALPILLPTLVFTNVYMSDESRGYCKLPRKNTHRKATIEENLSYFNKLEHNLAQGRGFGISYIAACLTGCLHFGCHKDRHMRDRGKRLLRKSMNRSAKFLFGTLVLRLIAWSWYIKAVIFGVRALRDPKRYLTIVPPDEHWSRELLTRLDFLQAALENAPQCVIQLYLLLTDANENKIVGGLTLFFSFIDFIRVASSVFWNVEKGPVAAKGSLHSSRLWSFMNTMSWILLYIARCAAMSLILGTVFSSHGAFAPLFIGAIILHCGLFGKVFHMRRAGAMANKVIVTTFISIFFLPELQSTNVQVMVQFYWAVILLENTFFTVPWRGLEFSGYCFESGSPVTSKAGEISRISQNYTLGDKGNRFTGTSGEGCLIDPGVVVILVPLFTIVGVILRLAVARVVSESEPAKDSGLDSVSSKMEARVANIYSTKWKTMSSKEMWKRFKYMLRKETVQDFNGSGFDEEGPDDVFTVEEIGSELRQSFLRSQQSIRTTMSAVCFKGAEVEIHREAPRISGLDEVDENQADSTSSISFRDDLPPSFFKPASFNSVRNGNVDFLRTLNVMNLSSEVGLDENLIDVTQL